MSLLDKASLIISPNGYSNGKLYAAKPTDGSGDLVWSRAGTKTRVNPEWLVEDLPYNLLKYSESLSNPSCWVSNHPVTTSTERSPIGYGVVGKFESVANTYTYTFHTPPAVSGSFNNSIYLKKDVGQEWVILQIWFGGGGQGINVWFNLDTGLIGTSNSTYPGWVLNDVQVESISNGWHRVSISGTTNSQAYFMISPTDSDGLFSYTNILGKSFFVFGAQMTRGLDLKPYLKTTDRLNIPSIDFTGGGCPSILVEPQATNLIRQSESLDTPVWVRLGSDVIANSTLSPSGILNADTFSGNGANSYVQLSQDNITLTATTYRFSVFVKKNTGSFFTTFFQSFASATGTLISKFDLNNGTTTTSGAEIINYGNGWYRCISAPVTINALDLVGNIQLFVTPDMVTVPFPTLADANGKSVFLYGAQLETGSVATSYIPTTSATITRVADAAENIPSTSLFNQSEGTFCFDINYKTHTGVLNVFHSIRTAVNQNFILEYIKSNGEVGADFYLNASYSFSLSTITLLTENSINKLAIRYKAGEYAIFLNGAKKSSNSSLTSPSISLAKNVFTPSLNGSYNSYVYFPLALSDAELIALTGETFNTYEEMASFYNYVIQ